MSDKARELLKRCLRRFNKSEYECSQLVEDIENFLAEPEKKREPLSDEEIESGFYATFLGCTIFDHFKVGVRFAEKHHGIGGENEPVGKTDKFNRLTEVEVLALMNRDIHGYSLICAVENQLAEKNQ